MKLKLLYLAQNAIESKIIKDELSERNIDSLITGNNLISAIGALPIDAMFSKVYVSEDNFQTANMFIEKYKENLKKVQLESWICGFKRHKKDHFPNSFSANAYDLNINFPFKKTKSKSFKLFYDQLEKYVLEKNIIFNLPNDSILKKKTFYAMYPNFKKVIKLKKELDKKSLLTSDLYYRLLR